MTSLADEVHDAGDEPGGDRGAPRDPEKGAEQAGPSDEHLVVPPPAQTVPQGGQAAQLLGENPVPANSSSLHTWSPAT